MAQTAISQADLASFLASHPAWKVEGGMLVRTYTARGFLPALAFVQAVGALAEAADHHPDIDIRWKHVTLRFVTHDAGNAVTSLDTRLAGECDHVFNAQP
jgi:4a-hydroxytetrahydrobiopterin dehydratase